MDNMIKIQTFKCLRKFAGVLVVPAMKVAQCLHGTLIVPEAEAGTSKFLITRACHSDTFIFASNFLLFVESKI